MNLLDRFAESYQLKVHIAIFTTVYFSHLNELKEVTLVPLRESFLKQLLTLLSILIGELFRLVLLPSLWVRFILLPVIDLLF